MTGTPYRVLLIQWHASPTSELLGNVSGSSLDVFRMRLPAAAHDALRTARFDAIVVDLDLPSPSDATLTEALRGVRRECPFLVVSSVVTDELRAAATRQGAEDLIERQDAATPLFPRLVRASIERAQARLRQRKLERLHDAVPDALLFFDEEGIVRHANRAALALFDRAERSVVSKRLTLSLSSNEACDVTIVRGNGPRVCEVRVVPFEWEGRKGHLASLRDVTSQREPETRLRRLVQSGGLGVVTVTFPEGRVVEANGAFEGTMGYGRGEMAEVSWSELVGPGRLEHVEAAVAELRTTGVSPPFEIELVRKDGVHVRVLILSAMLYEGRCTAFLIDVTARWRAEEAQKRAELALRESEARLRTAQKMVAIGRLASGIAHDFNNILSVVLTCADAAINREADEPMDLELKEICHAAERGAALTRQLLTFSQEETSEPQWTDPTTAVDGMTGMLRRLLRAGTELLVDARPTSGHVPIDLARLEQVLLNLVVNARDAVGARGTIRVRVEEVELADDYARRRGSSEPGSYVVISVSDDGVGMDDATRSRVFEPFFTTKRPGEGTGLGLSTVFEIVQQARGHIDVLSEPGRGSTFRVYLPLEAGRAPRTLDLAEPEPVTSSSSHPIARAS